MAQYDWLNSFNKAILVGIISGWGLSIDVHHWNQPNKSTLALNKPLIDFNSCT